MYIPVPRLSACALLARKHTGREDECSVLEKKNTYMQGTKIKEGKEKERQKTGEEKKKEKG